MTQIYTKKRYVQPTGIKIAVGSPARRGMKPRVEIGVSGSRLVDVLSPDTLRQKGFHTTGTRLFVIPAVSGAFSVRRSHGCSADRVFLFSAGPIL